MADESDVELRFGASIEALQEGSQEAAKSIKEFADQAKEAADSAKDHFTELAEVIGVAFTADAFKEWIASTPELGEQMERTAAKLGITGEQASELSGMAKLTGTDFDGLSHTMERFELGLSTTDKATSRVGVALHALGLSAREFIGVPMPQQLERLAEAFSHFADGPTKTAAAMALLGRAGAEMLPFLDRGKEGLEELYDILQRTGAVMSNEMVARSPR
jgi:hypothetical protein